MGTVLEALTHPGVRAAIRQAWIDSNSANPAGRHEEGGYIVQKTDRSYDVHRWSGGQQSQIVPSPLDANGCYNGIPVIAAFHTHPNPPIDQDGSVWDQRPSESDKRWHRRRNLPGIVVSDQLVFEIDPAGGVSILGKREEMF